MNLLGLLRRKSDGVGQKRPTPGRARALSSAGERLATTGDVAYDLDLIIHAIGAVAEDFNAMAGQAKHQRFTEYKLPHEHYRCISQIRFYWTQTNWPDAAFYIEHPESKRLLPIVNAIADRRCNGLGVVWVSDMANEPMLVPVGTTMYVSDEPDVAGKTLEEVRSRYGKD